MGHQEILARIEEKIVRLGEAKKDLQLQISRLKEENESYYRINKELLAQVDELTAKNRELEIHRSLPVATNDENRVVSKQRINELVKEIDECIALLNK
jgi:FtsZ-binding cell division protein ZapB